jgi:hypothetical protein
MNALDNRKTLYTELSSRLAGLDNRQLAQLTRSVPDPAEGWGSNGVIQLGKRKIFVKRVTITDRELENPFSTKNLHKLPTYYQYGLGSLGFGVHREVLMHIKTTNWVLDGSCPNFPLMYHYRELPRSDKPTRIDPKNQANHLRRWNHSRAIGDYRESRAGASHQVLLFLEYIPEVLSLWVQKDLSRLTQAVPQIIETLQFLRSKDIIHFDCHHWNIVTDGVQTYLTDFGLACDLSFQLTKTEREFFKRNTHYDFGEFLSCAVGNVFGHFRRLPLRKRKPIARCCGLVGGETTSQSMSAIRDNLRTTVEAGLLDLPSSFVDMVERYQEIDQVHRDFYAIMLRGSRKHYKYENEKVKRLLRKAQR